MACASGCHDELLQFQMESPGPVLDEENLCRGAYGPDLHFNKSGEVKRSLLRSGDLLSGSLSVWRLSSDEPSADEVDEIQGILQHYSMPNRELWTMYVCGAKELREIRIDSFPQVQVFHAYDDCKIDDIGGTHPSHATISICEYFKSFQLEADAPIFVEIRDALFGLITSRAVWSK